MRDIKRSASALSKSLRPANMFQIYTTAKHLRKPICHDQDRPLTADLLHIFFKNPSEHGSQNLCSIVSYYQFL
jgi:hypothetical protein